MTKKAKLKSTRCALVVLVLCAFAWRAHNLNAQSLWRDEIDAIYFALRDLPATLSMFVDTAQNGVLYFLALRPWLSLLGSSEFALRYLSVIFGVLSVPLLWQLCRRLMPVSSNRSFAETEDSTPDGASWRLAGITSWLSQADAPLMAAVLLAMSPYHLWYSQEGKMYALIIFLALLAAWFWLKGVERGGFGPWFGFLVTVTLAIYSHLLMVLLIPLFIVWFAVAWPQSKHRWKGFVLALAGLTLPYLPLLVWQWEFLTAREIVTALDFVPLGKMLKTLLAYHSTSFITARSILYLIPIFGLGLAALLVGFGGPTRDKALTAAKLSQPRRLSLIVAWLLVPIISIYVLSLRQPVFLPRYVIWITPAVMMLLALGLRAIWNGRGRFSKALALCAMLYVVAYWGVIGWQEKSQEIKTDLRSTVAYVTEHRRPEELLIIQIPNLHVAYQYYSGDQGPQPFAGGQQRLGWWAAGLSPAMALDDEAAHNQVSQQMGGLTFGASEIWVLLSEAELSDPNHLMLDWLDDQAILVNQVDFRGTQVRHYRPAALAHSIK